MTRARIAADGKSGDILAAEALMKANRLELPLDFFPGAVADAAS